MGNKRRHTEGPWQYSAEDECVFRVLDNGKRDEDICYVDTNHDDGRLIAASPTMLDGLKIAVARLARVDGGDSMVVATLLRVIHDATGEDFDFEAFIAAEDAEAA